MGASPSTLTPQPRRAAPVGDDAVAPGRDPQVPRAPAFRGRSISFGVSHLNTQPTAIEATDSLPLFASFGLHPALAEAIHLTGYTHATEVQAAAIPAALAGHDLMVSSATGSGKTAAFMLPSLHRLANSEGRAQPGAGPRILVLTPTRELSQQVTKACETYGRSLHWLRSTTVVGGVPYPAQLRAVRSALDVLIATPGRLLDLLQSGRVSLSKVEVLVLDEADRMLDMGFIEDIEIIAAATPTSRQTLMFSATFAGRVAQLAGKLLKSPQRIEVLSSVETKAQITQHLHWADGRTHKDRMLDHLLKDPEIDQAIVFTSTQQDAERLAASLGADGHAVAALHGGMPQGQRNRALEALRKRRLRVLVATDVAARGIDVPGITHVINHGLPIKAEDYVHRIGRTGRAGRTGVAVTLADHADAHRIRSIERFTTERIPVSTLPGLEPRGNPGSGARRPGGDSRPGRNFSNRPSGRPGEGRPATRGEAGSRNDSGAPKRARRP
ncbi:MAG: DEAD/DEAH box helicase [Burkholderiales bacterium]|nr:DEAD/DEAH box helicase [Burkholderiales bacterium]